MITIDANKQDLKYVERRLNGTKEQARRVLKDAINKTARDSRRRLMEVAKERYTVKNAGFNAHTKIEPKATLSNPVAAIKVKGKPMTQPCFRLTHPKSGVRTEVVKGSGLKQLVNSVGNRAFMAKVSSGKKHKNRSIHENLMIKLGLKSATTDDKEEKKTTMVLQRKGTKRYPLHGLHGPSVAKMLEKVYAGGQITDSGLKAEIERMYHENLETAMRKALNKK